MSNQLKVVEEINVVIVKSLVHIFLRCSGFGTGCLFDGGVGFSIGFTMDVFGIDGKELNTGGCPLESTAELAINGENMDFGSSAFCSTVVIIGTSGAT